MPTALLSAFAGVSWLSLITQFGVNVQGAMAEDGLGIGGAIIKAAIGYFGWFTLLTNIFCAAILTAHAMRGQGRVVAFLRRPGVVSCAAASIIVVGVVYHLLLASSYDPEGINLATDIMFHTVMPIGFVLAWTRLVPRGAVQLADSPWWASYITGYAIYIIIRGELLQTYPYFFIDVLSLGYPVALRNAALLGVAFVALSAAMVGLNRLVGATSPSES